MAPVQTNKEAAVQLNELHDLLKNKLAELAKDIAADEEKKAALVAELKGLTGKHTELKNRLARLEEGKKAYKLTINETEMALSKIYDSQKNMSEKFQKLHEEVDNPAPVGATF